MGDGCASRAVRRYAHRLGWFPVTRGRGGGTDRRRRRHPIPIPRAPSPFRRRRLSAKACASRCVSSSVRSMPIPRSISRSRRKAPPPPERHRTRPTHHPIASVTCPRLARQSLHVSHPVQASRRGGGQSCNDARRDVDDSGVSTSTNSRPRGSTPRREHRRDPLAPLPSLPLRRSDHRARRHGAARRTIRRSPLRRGGGRATREGGARRRWRCRRTPRRRRRRRQSLPSPSAAARSGGR